MFEIVLNDENEIERIDVLRTEININRDEIPPPEPPSSSDHESDDSDGGNWMDEFGGYDSEPEGGIWYNGDDYVNGRYVGHRDW